MQRDLFRDGLRFKLAQRYREDPKNFVSLSKEAVDSSFAREIIAELRNEGQVEEAVRGTIRLTPGVSRLLCKRPSFVFGDGAPGKGAVPLPRPISVEV